MELMPLFGEQLKQARDSEQRLQRLNRGSIVYEQVSLQDELAC